jgi:hypothetical protein
MYAVSAGRCFWTFHWTHSAFKFRVWQIKYLRNDKEFHPRKCDSATQPLGKLQIWCFLNNYQGSATHCDGKSYGDRGIWNSNYFSHAHDQVQLNDRYVQHGSCRWVRKRRGHVIISGFPHGGDVVFARLGCYAALCWQLFTDISRQPIGPIFEEQTVHEECREEVEAWLYIGDGYDTVRFSWRVS